MADITVSNDVDALMRSADNAEIVANLALPSAEEILNPLVEGQGLLNSFRGSAAAYSLRDLNKTNPDVVEVRRGSDETSRIFKANEIGSTLTNWVNAEVALPLDTASGAAAAYSLRNLSTSYSGNVVDVRRSSDDTEASFTAAEVAGSTMVDWVNTDVDVYTSDFGSGIDGWGTSQSLLSIVNTGADGASTPPSDDWLRIQADGRLQASWFTISNIRMPVDGGTVTISTDLYLPTGNAWIGGKVPIQNFHSAVGLSSGQVFNSNEDAVIGLQTVTWTITLPAYTPANSAWRLGTMDTDVTSVSYVKNFEVTQTAANAHVTKWYDQSGNDNHAVQATPASQPKIVEGGVLVADANGKPKLAFNGTTQHFDTSVIPPNDATLIGVANWDVEATTALLIGARDSLSQRSYLGQASLGVTAIGVGGSLRSGEYVTAGTDYLLFGVHSGNTRFISTNGVPSSDELGGLPNNTTHGYSIGALNDAGIDGSFMGGTISEIIIYDSDQTDNRKAIESNMADYHGNIDLPAGFDSGNDEVDGYVATWYDQSGNGNNAVQAVATSQPKIVEGGVLQKDDNNNPELVFAAGFLTATTLTLTQANTTFACYKRDTGTATSVITNSLSLNTQLVGRAGGNDSWYMYAGTALTGATGGYTKEVGTFLFNSTSSTIHANGVEVANGDAGTNGASEGLNIGAHKTGSLNWEGTIQEILIYDSDQSLVRKSIEFNINNAYSIY